MKKTKNIINKIFATFFLLTIILPNISLGAEQWYFFTTPMQTSTTVFFADKAECETARTKAFEGKTVDPEITKCQKKEDSGNGWYFINSSGQKIGVDGEKFTKLFANDTACNAGMLSYKIIGKVDANTKCIQATSEIISETEKNKRIEVININKNQTPRDDTYTLLAPIGGLTEIRNSAGIGTYLEKIFLIGIGLAGVLAVVMIVIYGIMYMGDESVFGKTEAKSKIMKAIGGLILALVSYALLRTINPDLIGGKVNVKAVSVVVIPFSPVDDPSYYDSDQKTGGVTSCTSLKKDPGRFTDAEKIVAEKATEATGGLTDLKTLSMTVKNNSLVQPKLAGQLLNFIEWNGKGYSITEAFKATTYKHVSKCHYLASCVDLAFRNGASPIVASAEQVKTAIENFRKAGLFAQFEVGSVARYDQLGIKPEDLNEGGCPNVIKVNDVAEHFSVYLKP